MGRQPLARPVAHLDRMVGLDVVEVEDVVTVEHRQPGGLAECLPELHEMRTGDGDEAPAGLGGRRQLDHQVADAVVTAGTELVDGTQVVERRKEAGHGALGQVRPLCHLGHARRPAGEAAEDR